MYGEIIRMIDLCEKITQTETSDSTQRKKAIIHQVATMLSTFKNVLYHGHNHLLITDAGNPTQWLSFEH